GAARPASGLERSQPPQVAVLRLVIDARVRPRRGRNPAAGDHAHGPPGAPVGIKLPELQEIPALQTQTTARLRQTQRGELPFRLHDPERLERVFPGEFLDGGPGRPLEDATERGGARRAVAEAPPVRRVLRL